MRKGKEIKPPILDGRVVEPGYVILTLPITPSKNREPQCWQPRMVLKRVWAKNSYDAWLCAGRPKFEAVTILSVFYCWSERDHDNCIGMAFKGVLDGLKGNLVPDDSPEYLKLLAPECRIDRKRQRLELHIRERRES